MKASCANQAATEYGGWDFACVDMTQPRENIVASIREYFTEENFSAMWPGEDATKCGGYTLDECSAAMIEEYDRLVSERDAE